MRLRLQNPDVGLYVLRPFSILSGSSATAAAWAQRQRGLEYIFQYPQRIECDCGCVGTEATWAGIHLSVSSADRVRLRQRVGIPAAEGIAAFSILSGSSATAAEWKDTKTNSRRNFQYPQRIECDCGFLDLFQNFFGGFLSVSSADRVRLRQNVVTSSEKRSKRFQYPQRIECDCGPTSTGRSKITSVLSVSSADRVRLRHAFAVVHVVGSLPFSILSGSSATAAPGR